MRRTAVFASGLITALSLFATAAAQAAVSITIDKNNQQMTVAVDGAVRYSWPVSSGLPAHETPNGSFKAFRMEADHYSKEWDDAPMPHAIFFTKTGHAIHGTDSVRRLGNPASHGCVRLSRENAATLFALVKQEGVLNTTVSLSGSSQVALARRPAANPDAAVARRQTPVELAPAQRGGVASADGDVVYPQQQQRVYRRAVEAQQGDSDGEVYFDGYGWRRGQPAYQQPQYAPRPYYGPRGY